ncbi:hypothetical protein L3X38_033737 [Prunus dulcis]|uniref:Reverse transcriptase Ty1/copia-type domain-containing protein n=1 Tax=Prunus dulcis TaxID=3755 RepID=A0AAD4VHY8_PRUDU|nr:hypothetical protein L3X38_033737 [Prunus dulcis]
MQRSKRFCTICLDGLTSDFCTMNQFRFLQFSQILPQQFRQVLIIHLCILNSEVYETSPHPFPQSLTASLLGPLSFELATYKQASQYSHWKTATKDEYDALIRNDTWSLVPVTQGMNIIQCTWVYKVKRNVDGVIEHHKARLVAQGYNQKEDLDYEEMFSPVVKPATIRTIWALAISHNRPLQQLDVRNALLNDVLHEELYMKQPLGFIDSFRPQYVCRLHKALYGLKQAPRAWFQRLHSFFRTQGFSHSQF